MIKIIFTLFVTLFLLSCSNQQEEQSAPGMKCGAGKCGANMFDGNSAMDKKKKNILRQMKDDDTRKDCVINASSTKEVYNCVREPKGKKLTTKCGTETQESSKMKCGAGKCGASMQEKPKKKKAEPTMKCGAGKCGAM